MEIRLQICGTEPQVKEGTFVYCTGDLKGVDLYKTLQDIDAYILRSLLTLRRLQSV